MLSICAQRYEIFYNVPPVLQFLFVSLQTNKRLSQVYLNMFLNCVIFSSSYMYLMCYSTSSYMYLMDSSNPAHILPLGNECLLPIVVRSFSSCCSVVVRLLSALQPDNKLTRREYEAEICMNWSRKRVEQDVLLI